MALRVDGKTALVTGGGSGICLEFTKTLLSHGCNVLIVDLALGPDAKVIVEEKAGNKAKAVFQKTDVTNWAQLGAAFEAAIKEFGRLDIVCPGAGVFEPPWSSFWNLDGGVDNVSTNSYKTLEINITHPIRATQLAIDSFIRQKLGHGVVIIISSIAAQMTPLPCPMYSASKHAMSGFCRSLAHLEPTINIRVSAVAPGVVKTPIWTEDKVKWIDEKEDTWVTAARVAEVMLDLVQKEENIGGTVLEVGVERVRRVEGLNDPGPEGKGFTVTKMGDGYADVYQSIESNFGK